MPNPFSILGAPPGSDDEAIRFCYLEEVKRHPPDRDPERFQQIRAAYEKVKDARARLALQLFEPAGGETFEDLIEEARCRSRREKWTLERIRSLFIET